MQPSVAIYTKGGCTSHTHTSRFVKCLQPNKTEASGTSAARLPQLCYWSSTLLAHMPATLGRRLPRLAWLSDSICEWRCCPGGGGNSVGDTGPHSEWVTDAMGDMGLISGSVTSWLRIGTP